MLHKTWAYLPVIAATVAVWRIVLVVLLIVLGLWLLGYWAKKRFLHRLEIAQVSMRHSLQEGSQQEIAQLPPMVQQWLGKNPWLLKQNPKQYRIEQSLRMQLRPEQQGWYRASATQYTTAHPPAFYWQIHLQIKRLAFVLGTDSWSRGKAAMRILFFGLFPIVNVHHNHKLNQAAMQRYLAEIVWFPPLALSTAIQWETIDALTAKATFTYANMQLCGNFYFSANGNFSRFECLRYKDNHAQAQPLPWVVEALEHQQLEQVYIPTKLQLSWILESGKWTWLQLHITAYSVVHV